MIDLTTTAAELQAALDKATALPRPQRKDITGSIADLKPGMEAALERAAERTLAADRLALVIAAIERDDQLRPLARAVSIGKLVADVLGTDDVRSLRSLVAIWQRSGKLAPEHNYASLRRHYIVYQATELQAAPFADGLTLSSVQVLAEPRHRKQPGLLQAVEAAIRGANRLPIRHAQVLQLIRDATTAPAKRKPQVQPLPEPAALADLPDNVIPLEGARKRRVLKTLTKADFDNVSGALLTFIKAGDPRAIAIGRSIAEALPQAA